jgi:prepilin-type N-terminal cleavage/methylation domain-containing protein/prepilin-type processing-associated H-X9-DG protein
MARQGVVARLNIFSWLKLMISKKTKAFTLVEILAVISIIALLLAILVPVLSSARSQACAVVCRSNLRQLVLANISYSNENDGFCVAAASDIWGSFGGRHRWHGVRNSEDEPFDPLQGPLAEYLSDGKVKECPGRVRFVRGETWGESFEKGCGGYGYNMTYLGSCTWQSGLSFVEKYRQTTRMLTIFKPDKTLMFADTAFNQNGNLIEYSFAEPPYIVINGELFTDIYSLPSIHFRHRRLANVGWSDGHVDSHQKADCKNTDAYNEDFDRMGLGWFEPMDNSLFDLK